MASSHNSNSDSDDEEDFGPVLPSVHPNAPSMEVSHEEKHDASCAPPLKRERLDYRDHATDASQSPPSAPGPHQQSVPAQVSDIGAASSDAAPARSLEETEEQAWERYTRQHLPHAPLYERSFQHTSLQDTYDALAAKEKFTAPYASAARTVHDVCVHYDSLGALIATIDAAGVVRVWRKLPRGLFFVTELDKVFGAVRKAAPSHAAGHEEGAHGVEAVRYHRTYWAHAYAALQLLVFACVEEEEVEAGDVAQLADGPSTSPPALALRTVRVHLRQVNPVTFTVEERSSFSFQVPVQPVAIVEAVDAPIGSATHSHNLPASGAALPPYALAYTRRPAFLTHQYTPHIAFFVALPGPTASASGGSGAVLCPCFPSSNSSSAWVHSLPSDKSAALVCRAYTATRISVAHSIVQCVQQTIGLERTGTAPCVLIDATGILDYCTIENVIAAASAATVTPSSASSGLTLKVMAGLAAVPAASPEARLWGQWIRFDRRQRTGFFSLLRDAQQLMKQQPAEASCPVGVSSATAAPADVQLIPGALELTPDGRYVVVWSWRLTRRLAASTAASAAAAGGQIRHSRIPSTQRTLTITVETCLHLLEFASGACVGRYAETLEDCITSVEDIGVKASEWADVARCRSRLQALRVHVEEGVASPLMRWYVMVPEVSCGQLLAGYGRAAASTATEEASSSVDGRRICVYEVALQDSLLAAVRRLPHGPGEWETLVRQGGSLPWRSDGDVRGGDSLRDTLRLRLTSRADAVRDFVRKDGDSSRTSRNGDSDSAGKTRGEFHVLCRAPLLLLRRAVTPSQDLKNLIAASPLGAALGVEGRKQLFLASTTTDSAESLLLTTCMDACATALLVYSCELPFSGVALRRFFLRRPLACALTATPQEDVEADQPEELQKQWAKACQELHRERDYACGALLMTTVAPPPGNATSTEATPSRTAAAAAGVVPETSSAATDLVEKGNQEGEDEDGMNASLDGSAEGPGNATAKTAQTAAVAPARALQSSSSPAEAYVQSLLKDVLPELSLSTASTTRLPTALVHVRGYGTIRVHLLPRIAPLASDNFIRLSRRHYYDRLLFHRVIPHVIVQGGCPRGDGTGGESGFDGGAPFPDEALDVFPFFDHTADKRCCWLCMANAGPNTNGSQFFFTVPGGEAMPWLNAHHTVFGFAVDGLDVVRAISLAARNEDDKPLSPVIIERVDILSS